MIGREISKFSYYIVPLGQYYVNYDLRQIWSHQIKMVKVAKLEAFKNNVCRYNAGLQKGNENK